MADVVRLGQLIANIGALIANQDLNAQDTEERIAAVDVLCLLAKRLDRVVREKIDGMKTLQRLDREEAKVAEISESHFS